MTETLAIAVIMASVGMFGFGMLIALAVVYLFKTDAKGKR